MHCLGSLEKQGALKLVHSLIDYYDIHVWSDNVRDSDTTEIILHDGSLEAYMEQLFEKWGVQWHSVVEMNNMYKQTQPPLAGVKRGGDAATKGTKKTKWGAKEKARWNMGEETGAED